MKRFVRQLIARAVAPLGYIVDGNHVFTVADSEAINRGNWRASVTEKPQRHPARVVRFAELLAKTY